jgi:hypothetical protein
MSEQTDTKALIERAWAHMVQGETVEYPVADARAERNLRRNISQYGTRNHKSFRCRIDRTTEPTIMRVTRLR